MTQYLNEALCKACGGKCCQRLGGAAIPEDIIRNFGGSLKTAVTKALQSGDWVVDWWEGDPRGVGRESPDHRNRGYYLRPRSEGDSNNLLCPSWGGACLLLASTGCRLSPELRPISCRAIEPMLGGKCIPHRGGKNAAALAWLDHHDWIIAAVDNLEGS